VGAGREVALARAVPVPVVVRNADAEAIAPRKTSRTAKRTADRGRQTLGFLDAAAARRGAGTGGLSG
jgi:hypothetical protein